MTDLPCNERNSHPRCNLRPTTREQFGLIYSDLNLAAVPTIARPVPVGAAVSDSKILTASGRVTPVHMVVYTSRSDDSTTVTVSTVKACTSLSCCTVFCHDHIPGFETLTHLQARLSRVAGSAAASAAGAGAASRTTFSTAPLGAASGSAKALPATRRLVSRVLMGSMILEMVL
jgi:hypothetical protein